MNLSQADIKNASFVNIHGCPIARLLKRNGFPVLSVGPYSWTDESWEVHQFTLSLQQLSHDLAVETDVARREGRPVNFKQFVGRKVSL